MFSKLEPEAIPVRHAWLNGAVAGPCLSARLWQSQRLLSSLAPLQAVTFAQWRLPGSGSVCTNAHCDPGHVPFPSQGLISSTFTKGQCLLLPFLFPFLSSFSSSLSLSLFARVASKSVIPYSGCPRDSLGELKGMMPESHSQKFSSDGFDLWSGQQQFLEAQYLIPTASQGLDP